MLFHPLAITVAILVHHGDPVGLLSGKIETGTPHMISWLEPWVSCTSYLKPIQLSDGWETLSSSLAPPLNGEYLGNMNTPSSLAPS